MDNAPIHRKNIIKQLIENTEHEVIFLPPYSPDLNDIEHDFADAPNCEVSSQCKAHQASALKRIRMYAPVGTSLDKIIADYCIS